jgi:phosphonate transport system permease protein
VSDPLQRRAFSSNGWTRAAWILLGAYLLYAVSHIELTPARLIAGFEHGARFVSRLFPPNFERRELLLEGIVESLQIAVLASVLAAAIALPLSLAAARNLMPAWLTWPARAVLVLCRAFHPIVVAILLVKAVGFGALAGILALTIASIGFLGKLFTEAIEEVSLKQVEAVRASGAPFMSIVSYAIVPQVLPRFVGFIAYETDANVRNSTMVGIVGAGGIGGTLFAAFLRFDFDLVCAIALTIVAVILAGEVLTMRVKRIFNA